MHLHRHTILSSLHGLPIVYYFHDEPSRFFAFRVFGDYVTYSLLFRRLPPERHYAIYFDRAHDARHADTQIAISLDMAACISGAAHDVEARRRSRLYRHFINGLHHYALVL